MPLDLKLAMIAVFAQVLLTFYAAVRMGMVRVAAIKEHKIKLGDIALATSSYPDEARKHGNNLTNQFEFPILLYAVVGFSIVLEAGSMLLSIACLGFVITRFWHRFVHVSSNNVTKRFKIFLLGITMLFVAWILLGLAILGLI
ncbi:MAG: hypothetical protein ACI9ZD_001421 [Paracoccaceae bacterium]|jgi:hypothetical protein